MYFLCCSWYESKWSLKRIEIEPKFKHQMRFVKFKILYAQDFIAYIHTEYKLCLYFDRIVLFILLFLQLSSDILGLRSIGIRLYKCVILNDFWNSSQHENGRNINSDSIVEGKMSRVHNKLSYTHTHTLVFAWSELPFCVFENWK